MLNNRWVADSESPANPIGRPRNRVLFDLEGVGQRGIPCIDIKGRIASTEIR
jgi:hypothetical protein